MLLRSINNSNVDDKRNENFDFIDEREINTLVIFNLKINNYI